MKNLPEFQHNDLKDHLFRDWNNSRMRNGKTYLFGHEGVPVEVRPATLAANQDLLYAAEECLNNPAEIWQTQSGDRYTHLYTTFYGSGALVVSVSFSYALPHKVDSIKFVRNPDEVRKGVLFHG